jgi:CDP-paratose 2-epimerase
VSGRRRHQRAGHVLVTGGAGFIGTNLVARLAAQGRDVVVLDDLSRPGVDANLRWACAVGGDRVVPRVADVADADVVRDAVAGAREVYHLAAQVAVTTSLDDPVHDFDVNLRGTLVLLEALRRLDDPPPVLFTSTNKVYGGLDDVPLRLVGDRWEPTDAALRARGVGEERPLQFSSPYGCSKGGADQYVLDYAKTYDLPAVVFRMSCIYGPHQCGNEDQGWVAHFVKQALADLPVTIYGDGRQVRDVLFVEDLLDCMQLVVRDARRLQGTAFNLGGGPSNTVSLLELLDLIDDLVGRRPPVAFGPARRGDQRYYVTDTAKVRAATGWAPQVGVAAGVERLFRWLRDAEVAVVGAV